MADLLVGLHPTKHHEVLYLEDTNLNERFKRQNLTAVAAVGNIIF